MPEESISIAVDGLELEGLFSEGSAGEAWVLCHPHPLYGGDMHNNVVELLRDVLADLGRSVLRFNSRGVGMSTGVYDEGRGETRDLLAAVDWARNKGYERVHVAAYSFGAWVALNALAGGLRMESTTLVSLPVDFMDCGTLQLPACPCLLTRCEQDQFCSATGLEKWLAEAGKHAKNARVEVLPGCDHFYWGAENRLRDILRASFSEKRVS